MDEKRKSPRRAESQPGSSSPASVPPTAPPSSRSEPSTPFTPSSSFSKSVLLSEWWLIKSDADCDGKRLAIGGLHAHGRHVTRVFTSAPVVRRYDAYTVETADGITVRIQGFINKPRSHHNGIPPEVSRCFLVGFPFNWDHYANGEWNKAPSPTIPVSSSEVNVQSQDSSEGTGSGFPTRLGALLDALTTGHVTSRYDLSSRNFTCGPIVSNGCSPVNAALHDSSGMSNTCSSIGNADLPFETLIQHGTDKINQSHENGMGCTDRICSDSGGSATGHAQEASCLGNGLHDGVHSERSVVNIRVVTSHNNSLTVKKNHVSKDETGHGLQSSLQKETELEKTDNLPVAVNIDPVAHLPNDRERRLNDERTKNSINLIVEGVSNDLSPKKHHQHCNQLDNYTVRCQKHAEKITRVQAVGVSEDSPLREDSVGKDSDPLTGKISLPLEASFESPPASAQIKTNNDSTPNSAGMVVKIGAIGLSLNVSRLLHPKYERQLADSAVRSESHAQRIRVDGIGDSEVRKGCNRKGDTSLTVNTEMVLETALKSSPNDKERKLNDEHSVSSSDFAVERVSNNLLTTKRNKSHHILGSRREGYALRSRDRLGKIGVNDTGVSQDSLGRKKSEQNDANSSMVDMNVSFEPLLDLDERKLCKAPSKKQKGKGNQAMRSILEVNDHRSVSVEHGYTNALGGVEQIGHMHVQSLVAGGIQEATLVSPSKEPSSKHYYKLRSCSIFAPVSPDKINKKGVDHSEHSIGLRKSSESFKMAIPCSVIPAIHVDGSMEIQSDKASDIIGKKIEELYNNQDGNQCEALTEAQMTEEKITNTYRRKTVWRPSYVQESPLTRDKVNKLPVTSPELLNLKRSRSGRLLVPRIDRWRQEIIYDMDGTITGITGLDILNSPCKGSKSEPQKKRKLP